MRALTVRVQDELHDEAVELLESLGLNLATAVNVFLRQCVINRAIPFPLALDAQRDRERSDDGD